MKKLLLICMATISFFSENSTYAANRYRSVEDMVADQKIIRVLLDEAAGYGNQAATINMMNRVWQMKFQGTYELIYPDDQDEDVQKVISLFNLPNQLPVVYHYEDRQHHKITFIGESEYIKQLMHNEVYSVNLSMTGAHDTDTEDMCESIPACKKFSANFADFTNSNIFVELQPWFNEVERDSIDIRNDTTRHPVRPPGQYLVYPIANFEDVKNYILEDPDGKSLLSKIPALKPLIDGIDENNFNLLSIYGYTFQKEYSRNETIMFPQNIIQVITAARYAQLNGLAEMQKPLIIAVFYNYTEEMNEIASLMQSNDWKDYEKQGADKMRTALLNLGLKKPNVFFTASLSDTDASKKIQSLQPGQVLLLSMGKLPKIVFDGIYSHIAPNVWPQFREGEGSLSMLLLKGKPHFRCQSVFYEENGYTKWEPGFSLVKDTKLKSHLNKFYGREGFCALNTWNIAPDFYKTVGELIIDSKNANSSFTKYFIDLKNDASKLKNDRIYRGLEEALKIINKTE